MNAADAEEYTQALGQVVAGGWRQIALGNRLGVPKALGLSVDAWVQQRLGGYVKMGVAERRQAVAELTTKDGLSQRHAAAVLGVSDETVRRDLAATNVAAATAVLPAEPKEAATNVATPLDVITGLAADEAVRDEVDRDHRRERLRADREATREARPAPPLPTGCFRLLYADPPWRYEHVVTESRAIENQYPTMDLDAICALVVPAAADAVLFLWATSPKLAEAMQVIDRWGFSYRTCAVWDKDAIGMGYYFRQQHELLLVAARGASIVPAASARPSSVLHARRGRHSEKPKFVYDLLELMYPDFDEHDRVELFQREPRAGWAGWGNESGVAS